MIGMTLKVEMFDGSTHEAPVTYGVASRWEDQHPNTSIAKFLDDMKYKQLAWLAWDAVRSSGVVVEVFSKWLDKVGDITFIPQAEGWLERPPI